MTLLETRNALLPLKPGQSAFLPSVSGLTFIAIASCLEHASTFVTPKAAAALEQMICGTICTCRHCMERFMAVCTLEDCSANRSLGRLMRRIDRFMTALVESRFDEHEISFMQWLALKVVRDGIVRNAGELSRELAITTGATTRMIDVLEQRGLLDRDRDTSDRRVVRLALTETGRETVGELSRHVVGAWNEVLVDFDQADADRIVADLVRLLAAVERVAGAHALLEAAE